MPRKRTASWDRLNHTWVKMIRGKRHRVTCRQLGLPRSKWTKEQSLSVANEYFESLLNPLPALTPEAESELLKIESRLKWAQEHQKDDEIQELTTQKEQIENNHFDETKWPDDPELEQNIKVAKMFGISIPKNVPSEITKHFFGSEQIWQDRLADQPAIEREFSLQHHAKQFIELASKSQSAVTNDELKSWINRFTEHLGNQIDVRKLNKDHVTKIYFYVLDQDVYDGGKVFRFFKRFIRYLIEQELTTPPNNLDSKLFRFQRKERAIKKHSDQFVIDCLNELPDRLKLYALLGLNCSMTVADISQLAKHPTYKVLNNTYSERAYWDAKNGTITRSRYKLRRLEDPPITTYKLFNNTHQLLLKLASDDERLVLTSKNGTVLKSKGKDLITQQFDRNKENQKHFILQSDFRSIGATAIGSNKHYKPYREMWLANKPQGITDQHYDAGEQTIMAEICDWLAVKFKQN